MNTLKTVADFPTPDDAERAIEVLVESGIDPNAIEVMSPAQDAPVADVAARSAAAEPDAVRLAVTAPDEDVELVEDILRDAGTIDLAASETPALGWAGDPDGETMDKTRTPAIGWAGKVSPIG
jgi:hypothetical protein